MVNESKNMYIPEDTLENHQGMLPLAIFLLYLFSGKHLETVHGRVGQGREGEMIWKWGWDGERRGGGRRRRGERERKGRGCLARAPQQMDKCLCFALRHFLLLLRAVFVYLIPPPPSAPHPRRAQFCAASQLVL